MSQSSPPDGPAEPHSQPVSAADALPPVEPPNAGFILQLFIVPGVIVAVIVLIWLLFTWIARAGDDPAKYVEALRRSGPARWQAAVSLTEVLRNEREIEFKRNRAAASELAKILAEEVEAGEMEEHAVTLRVFLCRALGEFHVDDGLAVLLDVARTVKHPIDTDFQPSDDTTEPSPELADHRAETHIRRAAIEGIALLSEHVRQASPASELTHPELQAVFQQLVQDSDSTIRSTAAFALGVLGQEVLAPELEALLEDVNADVRYNAATGLARQGSLQAVDVLVEMLDPDQHAALELERQQESRNTKRAMILANALRSCRQLHQQNPQADLKRLVTAIEQLRDAQVSRPVRVAATETLQAIEASPSSAATAP